MWVAPVLPKPVPPVLSVLTSSRNPKQNSFHFRFSYRPLNLKVSATKQQQQLPEPKADKKNPRSSDLGWLPAFPHVLIASMSNFLFGYHIGVMNGPIVSVAKELGFEGNSTLEGLVVSIFIAGAFLGSVASGSLVDKLGCRRTFQLDTIPLILGALVSAQAHSLDEILWGRFLVGLGIGVNTVLVPIYISEDVARRYVIGVDSNSQSFLLIELLIIYVIGCANKIQRFIGNLVSDWDMSWNHCIIVP